MIKIISFDIGGTLLLFNPSKEDKYDIKNIPNIIPKTHAEVKEAYKEVFQKNVGTLEDLVQMFCNYLNVQVTEQITTFFRNKFIQNDEGTINSEALELLPILKQKGFKIICISNSNCLVKTSTLNQILPYIDKIYYSYEIGYTKNDDELYDIILKDLNVPPNEILHIGDTLSADYTKPKEHGFDALLYTNERVNDQSISNLNEVKEYIKVH